MKKTHITLWLIFLLFALVIFEVFYRYKTRNENWSFKADNGVYISNLTQSSNELYFSDQKGFIYSLGINGDIRWKIKLNCIILDRISFFKNSVIVQTHASHLTIPYIDPKKCKNSDRVILIDKNKGKVTEIKEESEYLKNWIHKDHFIYSDGTSIYRRDIVSDREEVLFNDYKNNKRAILFSTGIIVVGNTLFSKTHRQDILSINISSGSLNWHYNSGWVIDDSKHTHIKASEDLIYDDGIIYSIIRDQERDVERAHAFDAQSGIILSTQTLEAGDKRSYLSQSDDNIYVTTSDFDVYALRKTDLLPVWNLSKKYKMKSELISYNGSVYGISDHGKIIGFDEKSGAKTFQYTTRDMLPSKLIISDGNLIYSTYQSTVHSVKITE